MDKWKHKKKFLKRRKEDANNHLHMWENYMIYAGDTIDEKDLSLLGSRNTCISYQNLDIFIRCKKCGLIKLINNKEF